jgi:hypothetical protein
MNYPDNLQEMLDRELSPGPQAPPMVNPIAFVLSALALL